MKPVRDRIMIEETEVVSAGGIIMAGQQAVRPVYQGRVVALGDGYIGQDGQHHGIISCNVGDVVLFGNVASTVEHVLDGKKYFLVQEAAVVAIIQEA